MTVKRETTDAIKQPVRGFPWRLLLFAMFMTAGAVAGGYFTWQYRGRAATATERHGDCVASMAKLSAATTSDHKTAEAQAKQLAACQTALGAEATKGVQLETQLAQLSTNLSASKEELATLRTQRAEAEKRLAAIQDIQRQFAKMTDTGQLNVTARRGSLVLSLPAEVLFASGSAEVSEQGELAVLEVGFTLKKLTGRRFLVLGHTDDQPLKSSTFKDNWELSAARALNVTRTLVKAGMDPKNLIAAGAGEHDPLGKDRAKNRRIEIALLPALDELPALPASLEASPEPTPTPTPTPTK